MLETKCCSLYNKEIKRNARIMYVSRAASLCNYASGRWCLRVSYEENSQAEQWSRNVSALVRLNRSLRGKRGDQIPCHCTACLSYRLTYFRSVRIQWQATLAIRQRRRDAASLSRSLIL